MKFGFTTLVAALVLGSSVTAPALAFTNAGRDRGAAEYRHRAPAWAPLGSHDGRKFTRCPRSSASEGNANQQNFPVKQYGQTSGGYRC